MLVFKTNLILHGLQFELRKLSNVKQKKEEKKFS